MQLNQTYKQIADSFDIDESRVQTSITSIWDTLRDVLVKDLVPSSPFKYTPRRKFVNHPDALGAIDATLIEVTKPTNREDNKAFYSGKHGRHGGKVQVLVGPDGTCLHMSNVLNGSRHDYYLYQESGLEQILTRGRDKKDYPKILADGGYLGMVQTYSNVVIPVRKAPGGSLTSAQKEFNRLLSQDRSVVERFFGRLKLYWNIMRGCTVQIDLHWIPSLKYALH